jgi:hypothetical protein
MSFDRAPASVIFLLLLMSIVCNHLHGMKEAHRNTSDELDWIHLQRWLSVSTPTSAKRVSKE